MAVINPNTLIQPNETAKAYRIRLYKNKDLYGLNNNEIGKLCNEAFGVEWTESAHRKHTQNYLKGYNDAKEELGSADQQLQHMIDENKRLKREAEKELKKVQSEKLEYSRWLREEARDELIKEHIIEAIQNLEPIQVPSPTHPSPQDKSYVLCYSDPHYGTEFTIEGLFGEVINQYSPEIFEKRMWELYNRTKKIIEKEKISTLHIYDFGDSIDGMLRVSQLWKLRYGVIESTMRYAEFISTWINEFTKIVNVRFQMVIDANHSQLRLLGQPKNTFKDENMSRIIMWFIKERLKNNPNLEIIENPTGLIFDNHVKYNLLGSHGEHRSMAEAISKFSQIYKVPINYLLGGHTHHNEYKEVGKDIDVITIPSIIGIDDYSMSIQASANPAAKLLCFEEGCGKSLEYYIKLQ